MVLSLACPIAPGSRLLPLVDFLCRGCVRRATTLSTSVEEPFTSLRNKSLYEDSPARRFSVQVSLPAAIVCCTKLVGSLIETPEHDKGEPGLG